MNAETSIKAASAGRSGTVARLALGVLLAVLLARAAILTVGALKAVAYPYELDYGEGIVWQQMRWMFTDKAYGAIDGFPAIVFHYPPLYHAVTSGTSALLGVDQLAAGRAISLICAILVAAACAQLVSLLLKDRTSPSMRRYCSGIAALLVFTYVPVSQWVPFMRVDMLALALGMFGLVFALKALERPPLIYAASLCFVAAVYTKQTSIAAPAAAFAVLLAVRPSLAWRGIATCLALGLPVLLALGWLTDGGFLRHIFLYNVNRFDPTKLAWIELIAGIHFVYVGAAAFVLASRLAEIRGRYPAGTSFRVGLAQSPADIRLLIVGSYLVATTIMLAMALKSGSGVNYFLEWLLALGLFAAMAPAEAARRFRAVPELSRVLACAIPGFFAIQAVMTPLPRLSYDGLYAREPGLRKLSQMIAAADKPVISDDMVLLVRSGRDVLWESAIFSELAGTEHYDDRPFIGKIRRHDFAFFVTLGERGRPIFDQRYSPAVADAIDDEYPRKQHLAGLTVHLPPE